MVTETPVRNATDLFQVLFGCKHRTTKVKSERKKNIYTLSATHNGVDHAVEIDGSRRNSRGERGAMAFHALKNAIRADAHGRPLTSIAIASEEYEQFAVDEEPDWP